MHELFMGGPRLVEDRIRIGTILICQDVATRAVLDAFTMLDNQAVDSRFLEAFVTSCIAERGTRIISVPLEIPATIFF